MNAEQIPFFDVSNRLFEVASDYANLFLELKECGAFAKGTRVFVKVSPKSYLNATYMYNHKDSEIGFGKYVLELDC